jgi:hypothetical protein
LISRPEPPLRHGFDGFFVEPETEHLENPEILGTAVRAHLDRQHHHALIFRFARRFRELGLHFENELGGVILWPVRGVALMPGFPEV